MFLETLEKLMLSKGYNKNSLSKASGIPYTTIVGFYTKGTENIRLSTLRKLADFFGVTLDYLICGEESSTTLTVSAEESSLILLYRNLNNVGKAEALKRMHELTKISDYTFSEQSFVKKRQHNLCMF